MQMGVDPVWSEHIYEKNGPFIGTAKERTDSLMKYQAEVQCVNFYSTVVDGSDDLFQIRYSFVQRKAMERIVIGGNIRCPLKLAGTEYWPEVEEKILLLEAYNGGVAQMVTYLNQLKQMGVFQKIAGILLGTFTAMERDGTVPGIVELVKMYAGSGISIVCTPDIGHGNDAKAIWIGTYQKF